MSVSGWSRLIIGVEVDRYDFFKIIGTKITCNQGHERPDNSFKFCPQCGNGYSVIDIEEPTKAFLKWCGGNDPFNVFDEMWEEPYKAGTGELGLYSIDIHNYKGHFKHLILGCLISNAQSYNEECVCLFDYDDIAYEASTIKKAIRTLNIEGEIMMWHTSELG